MKRIATFFTLLLLCNVSYGIPVIIDLTENPGALPADKPRTVDVTASGSVDGVNQNFNVTLTAVELNTATNLVTYLQLSPVNIHWAEGDLQVKDMSSVLDPTGSFAASYTDIGAPSVFSTTFLFPAFAPTLFGPVSFFGSVSGTITDGTSTPNGVSYTPTGLNPGVFKYELFDTTSASIATFYHDPGSSFPAGPPNTHNTGPYDNSGSPIIVGAGPNGVGTVVVTSSFTGSGGIDNYAFTGRWDVVPVPEPSTMMLAALGALSLFGIARRSRRK